MVIVAEIGLAHGGSEKAAEALIQEAAAAGADAVKFQVYQAAHIWSADSDIDKRQFNQLPVESYMMLAAKAHKLGLQVGASFFSEYGATLIPFLDFLKIGGRSFPESVPKIIMDSELPVYVSCRRYLPTEQGPANWLWMACSNYPDSYRFPVNQIEYVRKLSLERPWGYSSHSVPTQIEDCLRAAYLGASVIEKHFCLSREDLRTDRGHSLEPAEFASLVRRIKDDKK